MQIDHERVLEIGTLWDSLTITHFYRNGFYIFAFLVKRHLLVFTCMLKGTATLMISMFNLIELYEP